VSAALLKAILRICRNGRRMHTGHTDELREIEVATLRRLRALRGRTP
jgi:hypothetical protein